MAKLLCNSEWYFRVSSSSYYEVDFEALLLEQAEILYPEYFMVDFKTAVSSDHGVAKPDMALIEREYRRWWIVEIELAHHPRSHAVRQVEVFATANYGLKEAEYLKQHNPSLHLGMLTDMMKGAPPGVLVIVNGLKPKWADELIRYDAIVATVEMFRSDRNQHILQVNGAYPSVECNVISICRLDPYIPRLLLIESPANLPSFGSGPLSIEYMGSIGQWERMDTQDRVWLNPVKSNPLSIGKKFSLLRGDRGQLSLVDYI